MQVRRFSLPFVFVHAQPVVANGAAFHHQDTHNILVVIAHFAQDEVGGVAE